MNILITGKNGYIAKGLTNYLSQKHNVTCVGREDFDLKSKHQTINWFKDKFFDVVIHTAISGGSRHREDTYEDLGINLAMFFNLYYVRSHYTTFINLGSGAELTPSDSYYGLSKHVILTYVKKTPKFYNLRIFGIFDENELNTRFIKSSITRYKNKQPIIVHQDKYMDFIHMEDFCNIVDIVITTNPPYPIIDCVYDKKYRLTDIADLINHLDDYTVPVIKQGEEGISYVGTYCCLDIKLKSLEENLNKMYEKGSANLSLVL